MKRKRSEALEDAFNEAAKRLRQPSPSLGDMINFSNAYEEWQDSLPSSEQVPLGEGPKWAWVAGHGVVKNPMKPEEDSGRWAWMASCSCEHGHKTKTKSREEGTSTKSKSRLKKYSMNDNPPEASLLGIPAELRNEIYRLVLVVDGRVSPELGASNDMTGTQLLRTRQAINLNANRGLQPGLLRTCRQIRNEAMPIYTSENIFNLTYHDLHFAPQTHHWCWEGAGSNLIISIAGSYSWSNFKRWLHLCFSGRAFALPRVHPSEIEPGDIDSVLWRAFEIVRSFQEAKDKGRKVTWAEVSTVLEIYREAMDDRKEGFFFDN